MACRKVLVRCIRREFMCTVRNAGCAVSLACRTVDPTVLQYYVCCWDDWSFLFDYVARHRTPDDMPSTELRWVTWVCQQSTATAALSSQLTALSLPKVGGENLGMSRWLNRVR